MVLNLLLGLDLLTLRYLNNKRLELKETNDYQLKLGYKDNFLYKRPLVVDMKITPHILVCGLSNSGKTKMIEFAIKNKNVVLLNVYQDDFKAVNCQRINGKDSILEFLNSLLILKFQKLPLYIVIDELLTLCIDKRIVEAITNLLAIGKHLNVFIIGISQQGTKESVKFKDLFNVRVCFRQVEESSYRAVLGYSPQDTHLVHREFYLYSDYIEKGYTYTI